MAKPILLCYLNNSTPQDTCERIKKTLQKAVSYNYYVIIIAHANIDTPIIQTHNLQPSDSVDFDKLKAIINETCGNLEHF